MSVLSEKKYCVRKIDATDVPFEAFFFSDTFTAHHTHIMRQFSTCIQHCKASRQRKVLAINVRTA
jgi:hypothetical protein